MGIQLSDWVENIVGKGENDRYEQFLLFPQCFQNCLLLMCQNEYLWSKGLTHFNIYFVNSWYLLFFNPLPNDKILNQSKLKAFADGKMNLTKKIEICFWKGRKHCGEKGENVGY